MTVRCGRCGRETDGVTMGHGISFDVCSECLWEGRDAAERRSRESKQADQVPLPGDKRAMTRTTYAPRWRLASWYPDSYSVEVEGEPGRVDLDGQYDMIHNDLWVDTYRDLRDAGIAPPPDADDDWRYPPDAYQRLPWSDWDRAPWHIKAAVLARRVKELEADLQGTRAVLRVCQIVEDGR